LASLAAPVSGRQYLQRPRLTGDSSMRSIRPVVSSCAALLVFAACHRAGTDEHMAHMSPGDMAAPSNGSRAAQSAALPPSNNAAKARRAATPRHAAWVKLAWEPGSADS